MAKKNIIDLIKLHQQRNAEIDINDILVVKNLVKSYDKFIAVNDISFTVKRGSLFAFLGLNGAGKSTTINIITSILSKNSGEIYVDGYNLDTQADLIKNEIGIVFQNSVLDPALTPKENLDIRAKFYGMKKEDWKKRLQTLIDMLDLSGFINRPVYKLSGGQKRRVDIARAMVHNPKLLILDEPTTGLDPQTRLSVWDLVNKLRIETDMTVFLTTHYMEEAEKATYVVIMDKGKIITRGTPTELKNQFSGDYIIIYHKNDEDFEKYVSNLNRPYVYNHDSKYYRITVKDSHDAISFIESNKEHLDDFEIEKGSMDDVFLNVTGIRKIMESDHE